MVGLQNKISSWKALELHYCVVFCQYTRRVILIAYLLARTFHFSVVLPLDKRTATSGWYVKRCSFVTSTLTYNFRNTVATDIKYALVESFESAECFWKVLNSMSM